MNGNAEVRKATARCTRCRKIGNGSRDVAQGLVVVVGMVVVSMIVADGDAEERHRVLSSRCGSVGGANTHRHTRTW